MKRAAKPTSRRYISKSGMLSSALPFAVMAMSSTAYAQTADNSASVAVPAGAVELSVANNSATDSDTVLAVITNNDEMMTLPRARSTGPMAGTHRLSIPMIR